MNCSSYDNFFRNFANKTSFRIIMSLRNKPLSVTAIARMLGEEQSKVSHNLAHLARCGILGVKQEGKKRIYSLNKETITPILNLVEKHVEKHCTGRCK